MNTGYAETAWRHESIPAELAEVRPHGDMVLIRLLSDERGHLSSKLWVPKSTEERDFSPRLGEVLAVGPGDPRYWVRCTECGANDLRTVTSKQRPRGASGALDTSHRFVMPCSKCGGQVTFDEDQKSWKYRNEPIAHLHQHAPMHVKPGDKVYVWRVPANGVVINDVYYVFVHEAQHILAVIEPEKEAA